MDQFIEVVDHESDGIKAALGEIPLDEAINKCEYLGDLVALRRGHKIGTIISEFELID